MRERDVERKFRAEVLRRGGFAKKLVPTADRDWPDRLVLLPPGRMALVELKRPGEIARPRQRRLHRRLLRAGFLVLTIDRPERFREVFEALDLLG